MTQPERSTDPSPCDANLVRYAQLGLRLLGVMFFFQGIVGVGGGLLYAVVAHVVYEQDLLQSLGDSFYAFSAGSLPNLLVGLYLMVGGRWVIEKVFLSVPREHDIPVSLNAGAPLAGAAEE